MKMTTLARRYAAAILSAAEQAGDIDRIESDLGLITYTVQNVPKLHEALNHPLLPAERKKQIVAEIFNRRIDSLTLHFLGLLIDKRRVGVLDEIEQEYIRQANEHRGVVPALVTSAVAISRTEQGALKAKLDEFTGKNVSLTLELDPSLIGGLTVRIGDKVIDGSVKGYLAALREKLLAK
jgi:F-type H+-transporting ATPase subunit delta